MVLELSCPKYRLKGREFTCAYIGIHFTSKSCHWNKMNVPVNVCIYNVLISLCNWIEMHVWMFIWTIENQWYIVEINMLQRPKGVLTLFEW